jgi:uncharacterized membrane protein
MMYWNGHMTTAGWILAIAWTAIVFALVAGAVYWLASARPGSGETPPSTAASEPSAREILDRRLARGELTIEQYETLRGTIEGAGAARVEPLAATAPLASP